MGAGDFVFQSGDFDRQVQFFHRTLVKDQHGADVAAWPTAYAKLWSKKQDLRGQKRFLAQQFSTDTMTEFTIRYRSDVVQTDRIIDDNGNTFEITQVSEMGRRVGLNLLCRAVVL